eukprot:UN03407
MMSVALCLIIMVYIINRQGGCATSPDTHVLVKGRIIACAGMCGDGMFDNSHNVIMRSRI